MAIDLITLKVGRNTFDVTTAPLQAARCQQRGANNWIYDRSTLAKESMGDGTA